MLLWVAQEKSRANTWKWHVLAVLSFCATCLCSVFIPPQCCFSQNITVSGNVRVTGRAWCSPRIQNIHQRRTSWNQMFSKTRNLTCHIPASTLPTLNTSTHNCQNSQRSFQDHRELLSRYHTLAHDEKTWGCVIAKAKVAFNVGFVNTSSFVSPTLKPFQSCQMLFNSYPRLKDSSLHTIWCYLHVRPAMLLPYKFMDPIYAWSYYRIKIIQHDYAWLKIFFLSVWTGTSTADILCTSWYRFPK